MRRSLNRKAILEAAVTMIDRDGLEQLSMRRLARELDVGTMSLYNHVPNKEALLDGVLGTVLGEMEVPPPDLPWTETARRMLRSFRNVARRHPNLVPLMTSRPPLTPEALRPIEAGFDSLRRAGVSESDTAAVYRICSAFVFGFTALEMGNFFATAEAMPGEMPLDVETLLQFPRLLEVAPHLFAWDADADFETGLDLLLAAIDARLGHPRAPDLKVGREMRRGPTVV